MGNVSKHSFKSEVASTITKSYFLNSPIHQTVGSSKDLHAESLVMLDHSLRRVNHSRPDSEYTDNLSACCIADPLSVIEE